MYLSSSLSSLQHFLQPIRARSLLPGDAIAAIFCNIEHILSLNRELLMFIQQKGPVEAFNNMGPFLKVYAHYVNNYNGALDLLHVSLKLVIVPLLLSSPMWSSG